MDKPQSPSFSQHSDQPVPHLLPAGFPASVSGDLTLAALPRYLHLQNHEVLSIEAALARFKECGLNGEEISPENFPLPPTLRERLSLAALEVHNRSGFCQIRGLDFRRYSPEDTLLYFLGIASYIGDQRGIQDKKGSVISHITNARHWTVPVHQRHGIHTNQGLPWHTDMGADLLAMAVLECAGQGGSSYIASSWAIYNDLAALYPDALVTLVKPDWPIQVSANKARSFVLAPLITWHDNKIMICLDSERLGPQAAQAVARKPSARYPTIPRLTQDQREALGIVSTLATKHRHRIDSRPGDIIFINNFAHLHARDPYTEELSSPSRHVVRLWLRSSVLGWSIPHSMRVPSDAAFGYDERGYATEDNSAFLGSRRRFIKRQYAVTPAPEYKMPLYAAGSAAFVIESSDEGEEEEEEKKN